MKTSIRQHDISDCAAACVACVARHYGEAVPLTVIREASGTSAAGTSIKGILDACRAIGFEAAAYRSEEKKLDSLLGLSEPVILHLHNKQGDLHFVVLEALSRRHARVMDPGVGKSIRMSLPELQQAWTGYLVTLKPSPGGKKSTAPASAPSLHSFAAGARLLSSRDYLLMLCGSVVYIVAGLCTALFLQYIIDTVIPACDRRDLHKLF